MSSLPAAFVAGSYQSASSVIYAIESYRHNLDFETESANEEEAELGVELDRGPQYEYDDHIIHWDEEIAPGPSSGTSTGARQFILPVSTHREGFPTSARPLSRTFTPKASERTPLIRKATSVLGHQTRLSEDTDAAAILNIPRPERYREGSPRSAVSPPLVQAVKPQKSHTSERVHSGKQYDNCFILLNAIAVLFGIGMLSEPLAFSYAGWIGGTILIILYGWITCHTAKILAHIVLEDPDIRSYSDIGRKVFGPRSTVLISTIFCLELFTVSVALVTLFADSLCAVMPAYSADTYKLAGLIFLIPAVMLPLSVLSYTSVLGIFSMMLIIGVILFDGFAKPDSPGSLWSPADTSLGVDNLVQLGISFGLFMAGFAGHAAIPTLARDMIDPSQFDRMIDWAFGIATGIYAVLGVAGYIMFGNSVSDEFSRDLMKYSTYPVLNKVALWGLVLTPLSKYALATRPLSITIEIILGIETSGHASPDDHTFMATPDGVVQHKDHLNLKKVLRALERTVLTILSVLVSILVPDFGSVMAVLGACFSFLLCVIGPLAAKIALAGKCSLWDGVLLGVAVAMAVWGTVSAVWSTISVA
ncbi:Vacuolar amino acid transporter 1 [Grifola frondosa]|uniref:Vacuolar amino acid transporter 1 n=1 Tax=Grifola frondosa TaxID=5627 RepID=A0A1C7MS16_GRIFR|nr:Vacuolar amino acid transporter 1 [Grifola frondosa]